MTPSELRTYVYNLTLLEETSANNTLINTFLDQAYFDLATADDWTWMLAPTATLTFDGSTHKSVALPANFFRAVSLWEEDRSLQLKPLTAETMIANYSGAGSTGKPMAYYIAGGEIVVKPIPNTTYTLYLDYYKFTSIDWTGTTEPPFAQQFHRALAEFAVAKVWERDEDYDRAEINFSLFRDTLSRMHTFYNVRAVAKPMIFGQDTRTTSGRASLASIEFRPYASSPYSDVFSY